MVPTLVEWAEFITENGVEAALARVDLEKARREAQRDSLALMMDKGTDVNGNKARIERIEQIAES